MNWKNVRQRLARINPHWVYWALLIAQALIALHLGTRPAPVPPPPREPIINGNFGWIDDPASVRAVAGDLPVATFADTPAFRQEYAGPEDVFLWDAARKVLGHTLPARDQGNVGACVAFATASAVEALLLIQIAAGGAQEYHDLAQEVIYGGARIEIGGGHVRGDGTVGAWAAKWCQQYGVVARGAYGHYDLSRYSEATCRQFGRTGVPREIEPEARRHPVRGITQVGNANEAKRALQNGYPVAVCSGQGFSQQRDAQGFARPHGSWAHCLAILGYQGGARPGFWLQNSWGDHFHFGPNGAGDPPDGGFWADAAVVDRMLRQGDSWAFADAAGFPARKLDWYAFGVKKGSRSVLPGCARKASRPWALGWNAFGVKNCRSPFHSCADERTQFASIRFHHFLEEQPCVCN